MKTKLKAALALAWEKRHAIVTTLIAVYTALHRGGVI